MPSNTLKESQWFTANDMNHAALHFKRVLDPSMSASDTHAAKQVLHCGSSTPGAVNTTRWRQEQQPDRRMDAANCMMSNNISLSSPGRQLVWSHHHLNPNLSKAGDIQHSNILTQNQRSSHFLFKSPTRT